MAQQKAKELKDKLRYKASQRGGSTQLMGSRTGNRGGANKDINGDSNKLPDIN